MPSDGGLRGLFRQHLRHAGHWCSLETGGTESGVPDLNVCLSGGLEVWIECKMTAASAVRLRPGQVGWLEARGRRGGRALVAVRRKSAAGPRRGPAADELWLVPWHAARPLAAGGLLSLTGDRVLGVWTGGPGRWCWPEVLEALRA